MNFRLPYAHIFSSIPDFVLALAFLATWIDPLSLGENMVNTMAVVIFLEFFIIHSAAFMTAVFFLKKSIAVKILIEIGLGLFYSLFVIVFTSGFGGWGPLISFWILIANRLLTMLSGPPLKERNIFIPAASWGISVFVYVTGLFLFEFLPVPDFGILGVYRESFIVKNFWIVDPASVMAFGFFYYFTVGVAELFVIKKLSTLTAVKQ